MAVLIVMENEESATLLGPGGARYTPFIASLAARYGLASRYYAITHPSLPNYLALIAGQTFGVTDDRRSCFPSPPDARCHGFDAPTLVDGLEKKGIAWVALLQSMPSGEYAQKHNPFAYFRNIAMNPKRSERVRALDSMGQLSKVLDNGRSSPRFIYIAPDLCHDMHGDAACPKNHALLREGDRYVRSLVTTILASRAFTDQSAIFLTWDEGDSNQGCCGAVPGGGHIVTIVVTRKKGHRVSMVPYNHYSLLRTLEDAWGLRPIADAAAARPMLDLLP